MKIFLEIIKEYQRIIKITLVIILIVEVLTICLSEFEDKWENNPEKNPNRKIKYLMDHREYACRNANHDYEYCRSCLSKE